MSLRLFIAPTSEEFAVLYRTAADAYNCTPMEERDSGFDLHCNATDVQNTNSTHSLLVSQGCRAVAQDEEGRFRAYWLAPRSSICKTPWRLANSMGLIDATYRGVIKAAFYTTDVSHYHTIHNTHQQRLCQLAAPDLLPWKEVIVVDELPGPVTARGEGGFGSTGTS